MKKNKIPREFKEIKGNMLIDTSADKMGDTVHITTDRHSHLSYNTRTKKTSLCFVDMLRDPEMFQILEIIK